MLLLASVLLAGCGGAPAPAPEPPPAEPGPVEPAQPGALRFEDATQESGLAGFRQENGSDDKLLIVETVGGGVALFDYDGDGRLDAYLTNGSRIEGFPPGEEPRDALYGNEGGGRFREVTDEAGLGDTAWTNGVVVVDFDGDDRPDLYLLNTGPNVLYRNLGDGRFEDVTAASGLGDPQWSTSAAFFDADRDGDLDVYVANYVDVDTDFKPADEEMCRHRGVPVMCGPNGLEGAADRFFVNEGGSRWRDATAEWGVEDPGHYGFQVLPFDHDGDGWLDLFVANDSVPNFLWRNEEGKGFSERALLAGVALSEMGAMQAGMGAALGDADGDGRLDLFVTNFSEDYNTLYRNDGDGFFSDVSTRTGLAEPSHAKLAWGCHFEDFDDDGREEIFVANGHVYPQVEELGIGMSYAQRNQIFRNDGTGRFEEAAEAGPGLEVRAASRGAAFGDVDGDGDLDVLVGNIDGPPTLLLNESERAGEPLFLDLRGTDSPRDPVGALVTLTAGGRRQLRQFSDSSSFLSSSARDLHFGLGGARPESLEIAWPSGRVERIEGLPAGRRLRVVEGTGRAEAVD